MHRFFYRFVLLIHNSHKCLSNLKLISIISGIHSLFQIIYTEPKYVNGCMIACHFNCYDYHECCGGKLRRIWEHQINFNINSVCKSMNVRVVVAQIFTVTQLQQVFFVFRSFITLINQCSHNCEYRKCFNERPMNTQLTATELIHMYGGYINRFRTILSIIDPNMLPSRKISFSKRLVRAFLYQKPLLHSLLLLIIQHLSTRLPCTYSAQQ